MAETGATDGVALADPTSEEVMLLEHVRRFDRARTGCMALHFHLSQLREHNRQPHFVRIAARAFDSLLANYDAGLYILFNSDLVLIGRDLRLGAVDPIVNKLRALFSTDPLTTGESEDPAAVFASWYDFSDLNDYTRFAALAKKFVVTAAQRRRAGPTEPVRSESMRGTALAPGNLTTITSKLENLPINDLIRRQTAMNVTGKDGRSILFREHFIAMTELRKRIAQDINLFGSPWLFQYLTESLDKRMLTGLAVANFATMRDAMSINLNMSSVTSREFRRFHEAAGPFATKVVIEMQMIDIFSDMDTFFRSRDWLQHEGYRVLVDGLSPLSLQFFDPSLLSTDFVKINWSSELLNDIASKRLEYMRETVAKTGKDKIILGRVETEDAMKWGLKLGIHQFQGYFVDRLIQALSGKSAQ